MKHDAQIIHDELSTVPGFAFPPGDPSEWNAEQSEWAIREGTDDSDAWIAERRRLIENGAIR